MKKTPKSKIKTSLSRKIFVVCNLIVLTLLMLSCALPFIYTLAVSLSERSYIQARQVWFWPKGFTLVAYEYLLQSKPFWNSFFVTVQVTFFGTLLNLVMLLLTAYPLSKSNDRLKGRTIYAWYFFTTMLVGGGLIPNYILITSLGLRDHLLALFLPGALPIFNLVLMINFFREIPIELEDAARVDGAGPVKILSMVYVPLSKPAIATISLFCMVGHWNSWFSGMLYMRSPEKLPLQTYLRNMLIVNDPSQYSGADYALMELLSDEALKCAQIIIAVIPILCAYPFLQKYFVKGIKLGGVKG